MEQHVERMLNEHVELCKKILNLGDFITDNNIFKTLSEDIELESAYEKVREITETMNKL